MREILFRGKIKGENSWVYGNLYVRKNGDAEIFRYCKDGDFEYHSSDVVRSTVGQYTGIPDKNGVKVFEGDICTFWFPTIAGKPEKKVFARVIYDAPSFSMITKEAERYCLDLAKFEDFDFGLEVIGNIYDNPELLGGAEK